MALFISSLNSGSNGNCYYAGNESESVLIDAGITCGEIEMRMSNLNLSMRQVKAIFISHEHIDHIRGTSALAKKYQLPVYITPETLRHSGLRIPKNLHHTFEANEPVSIGDLSVTPFVKLHDAADPYSFMVENNGIKVGVITDIGKACKQVIHYFKQCDACFLESNYDERMLEEGTYPTRLKNRIRGGKGHLSNNQALELFMNHKPAFMSHLFLSHISKNNNQPELVEQLFQKHAGSTRIVVASRYKETEVYKIRKKDVDFAGLKSPDVRMAGVQMRMFE
jgi:phosphoribosyl 1,2-cyclic phosphodiesterase